MKVAVVFGHLYFQVAGLSVSLDGELLSYSPLFLYEGLPGYYVLPEYKV